MAKPKNHPDKQAAGSGKDSDSASYRTIGIIFLVAGLAMAIPEST